MGTNPLVRAPLVRASALLRCRTDFLTTRADRGLPLNLSFLFVEWLGTPLWMWSSFFARVIAILSFDLGILHRQDKEIGVRESVMLSALYIALGLAFGGWVWWYLGSDAGLAYLTGFVVEKTLALDNVFVIALIFSFFAVPRIYQHRVLFWGILGVLVLRAIMIGVGATLVVEFAWVLYIFAAFLIVTGIKMLIIKEAEPDVSKNVLVRFMRNRLNVTDEHHGERFFVKKRNLGTRRTSWFITPLFMALVMVEVADVIFAVDSVPAIRDHNRSVHRLHLEHLCDPRPSRPLFRACGDDPPLPLPEARARYRSDLHRLEDLRRRSPGP
ncbi:TerC/Alx family metal homeostasis membrane protein [Mesorhizobium sp. LSHC420B00]|uniref:TerC/Alx family metal homeostasis membrane protein n=1 Tax=Mesorhizobium sp. LSHC420B00 TaxID=1287292 RepID=UPI0003FF9C52